MAQNKKVDITPGGVIPVLHVSQFDVGRTITFNLMDNTEAYTVPSGATVKIHGTKPSGLGFTVTGSVSGSVVTISTTDVMTDEYGLIPCELSITSGNTILGTANMTLDVEMAPHTEDTIDGRADRIVPELTLLVERVEAAVAKAEVLQESEAWAVGTRDGAPVDEEDPTYHNNSKYYSEQAELSEAAARLYKTDAYNSKESASNSATEANNKKVAAETAKAAAEAAQIAAEIAARNAQSVFAVVGNMTAAVDRDTKKVTLYFTESEQQEG